MIRWWQALARCLLPAAIRKPLADRVYALLNLAVDLNFRARVRTKALWYRSVSRPRLGRVLKPVQLRVNWLTQRLGIDYAGRLENFVQAMAGSPRPKAGLPGVTMMIGTLGCGGAERQLMHTLGCIKRRGHESVSLITANLNKQRDRFYLPEVEQLGVKVGCLGNDFSNNPVPEHIRRAAEKLPADLSGVLEYILALASDTPLVAHLWMDEISIKGGLAAIALGVPRVILSTRNLAPYHLNFYHPYMREGYRWLLQRPGVIMLNNSKAGARSYEQWLSLRKGTVKVVRNGLALDQGHMLKCREQAATYRARMGIPENADVLGGVLRLSEEKQPLLWIEIANRVRELLPQTHFLMVGDGPMRQAVEDKISQLGLSGLLHRVDQEKDIFKAMAAMDLLLLSSRAEGLPNVLLEAQAMGVPVVTTAVGGAPEALEHGVTGWVLEKCDPLYIAQVVVALLEDSEWRRKASAVCPEFVFENFGLERMFAETLSLYGLEGPAKDTARWGDE